MYTNITGVLRGWGVLITFIIMLRIVRGQKDCGGYTDAGGLAYGTGTFMSPNFPDAYGGRTHCIWVVEGPALRTISLTIVTLDGETKDGECLDYLEVRAGSASALELFKGCSLNGQYNITIETPNRWIWVKFLSDEAIAGSGFYAVWETTNNETDADVSNDTFSKNPLPNCQTKSFKCINRECVSKSWMCDGINDCGCVGNGCDEYACAKSLLSTPLRLGIGLGAGIVITIFCVLMTVWSESVNPWPPFKKKTPEPKKNKPKK